MLTKIRNNNNYTKDNEERCSTYIHNGINYNGIYIKTI